MKQLAILFGVSVIPGILWVVYFYRQDVYEKEPVGLVVRAFIAGALAIVPAGLLEAPIRNVLLNPPSLPTLLMVTIFGVGLVEEYLKYLAVRITVYNNVEFNEPVDGIVYAVSAGLGFAAFENVLYSVSYGVSVGIMRAVLTSIVHASFAGIVGFAMGMAKFAPKALEDVLIARGLIGAVVLHGLYDFLLITGIMPFYVTVIVVGVFFSVLAARIRTALAMSPFAPWRTRLESIDPVQPLLPAPPMEAEAGVAQPPEEPIRNGDSGGSV